MKLMKAFTVVLGALLISGAMVNAEETSTPTFELGSNDSWLHVNSANYRLQRARNGVSWYCEHNLNKRVGLLVSFCDYANTRTEIDEQLMPCLFAPLFDSRCAGLGPYAQFLFGGSPVWNSPSGISLAWNALATTAEELDYRRTIHISTKPIQVKHVLTKSTNGFGSFQNDVGYSAGVVFEFRGQQ